MKTQPQAVVMNTGVDDFHDLRLPSRASVDGAPDLATWRFSWVILRASRQDPRAARSSAASRPMGWDDGPLREKLEHLTRMKAAAAAGQDPADAGRGPFDAMHAAALADKIRASTGRSAGRRTPVAP